jgi:hypothetical protein
MLLLNSIVPEAWYTVADTEKLSGWSADVIYDCVHAGIIEAQMKPTTRPGYRRVWTGIKIQGCEIIRFLKENLNTNGTRVNRRGRRR